MTDIYVVLTSIRKNFSFLWDEFEFNLSELKPRDGYRNSGYEIHFENKWCKLVFMSEGGVLDEIYIRTKNPPYFGRGLKHMTRLLTNREPKSFFLVSATDDEFFGSIAEYVRPILPEILELAKTPGVFKEMIEAAEATKKSEPITIEMIRAERARLHSLGLDSSLGAAMENLRKRDKHE